MSLRFTTPTDQEPGTIASLLKRSYADLLADDPLHWEPEQAGWEQYDLEVYRRPDTVGACIFLSRLNDLIVGFGSWDPRPEPRLGIVGHNCILPEFRGRGYGKQQMQEILRILGIVGIQTAQATTNSHPFFVPAHRMYASCGFEETLRFPWDRDPKQVLIQYEKEITDDA